MGPLVYAKHLVSGSRLPFTAAYFGSIAMTLFFAIGVSALLLSLESYPLPCSSTLVYPVCPATAARLRSCSILAMTSSASWGGGITDLASILHCVSGAA